MTSIGRIIGELLLRHNCVIIPSFGGFVAKQTPAVIDYASGFMSPPKKSLLFNRLLINNDGLLLTEIAKDQHLTYDEATKMVQSMVSEWQIRLAEGQRITIENVGFLYADTERNICFEQDRFFNLLLESYGLSKVYFVSEQEHVKQAEQEDLESVAHETKVIPIQKDEPILYAVTEAGKIESIEQQPDLFIGQQVTRQKDYRIWRYVAAACLIPIAFYSFWIPLKTNAIESGVISLVDFNVFYRAGKGTYCRSPLILKEEKDSEYITLEDKLAYLPDGLSFYEYEYDQDLTLKVDLKKQRPLNLVFEKPFDSINSAEKSNNYPNQNLTKSELKNEKEVVKHDLSPQKDTKSKSETIQADIKKTPNIQYVNRFSVQNKSIEQSKNSNSNSLNTKNQTTKNNLQNTTNTALNSRIGTPISETKNANVIAPNSGQVKASDQPKSNSGQSKLNNGINSVVKSSNPIPETKRNTTVNSSDQNESRSQNNTTKISANSTNQNGVNNQLKSNTNIASTGTSLNSTKPIATKTLGSSSTQKMTATVEFIVGSFSSEENAKNLVSTLKSKGIQAEVSGKNNGLIRVSAGKANSEEELQKIIQKVKSQGFNGWIAK